MLNFPPNIYLSGQVLRYVDHFRYLGHFVTKSIEDDMDIGREIKNLMASGNMLIRSFNFLKIDTKCALVVRTGGLRSAKVRKRGFHGNQGG